MAHAVRGFSLLSVYSGGFSAVCPISYFNASVRRFNVLGYPYTAAAPLVLCPLFMALWRGVVPCSVAYRLRCQLAAVLIPLCPCRRLCPKLIRGLRPFILIKVDMCIHIVPPLAPVARSRWPPVAASPCVALRQSRRKSRRESRESRWQSRCESRKRLRQSRSFYPKIIVVYKIPCIKAGFLLPAFP